MIPAMVKSVYDQADLTGAEAPEGGFGGELSGTIEVEPGIWQLVCVPTRYGYWSEAITPFDTFTDADGTSLAVHTSDSGNDWTVFSGTGLIGSDGEVDGIFRSYMDGTVQAQGGVITIDARANIRTAQALFSKMPCVIYNSTDTAQGFGLKIVDGEIGFGAISGNAVSGVPFDEATEGAGLHDYRLVVDTGAVGGTQWAWEVYVDDMVTPKASSAVGKPFTEDAVAGIMSGIHGTYWGIDSWSTDAGGGPAGIVADGATLAKIENYVVAQLESKYGADVVTICNAYIGDDNAFRNYVPGVTPTDSPDNFPLLFSDGIHDEFTAFWILSAHGSPMIIEWETDV